MDSNLSAKFGPPPPCPPRHPPTLVLGIHFVVCVVILVVVQPPFVTDPHQMLCLHHVILWALGTTAVAGALGCCDMPPGDVFRGAAEMLHRAVQA